MEYKKKMLICDDTMEGIFTAVYDGWRWGNRRFSVGIAVREPDYPELFTENLEIISDSVKAFKVARTIKNRLGGQVYEAVCYAAASVHPEKGTAIFYLLRRALEKGRIDTRVLELLAPHFSDRFPNENWMIYDKKRQKVLAHEQGGECTVYIQAVLNTQETDPVQSDEYENLWKAFCSHITIPERKNPGLQRQFVPLKFRSNMPEFS
nr:DUF4130 domain-containing protein [uncultured Blautia sp.]